MSSLPFILSLADDLNRLTMAPYYQDPAIYYNRNPYMAIMPRDLQVRSRGDKQAAGPVSIIGKDGFQVCMDVAQFKPSELNVKVLENCIVVEGKHEEREDDHGYISRHFVRRYALPKDYESDKVVSTLSSDGVLTITVPKPKIEDKPNERIVQIQQVGPAHLNVKENPKLEDIGEDKDAN